MAQVFEKRLYYVGNDLDLWEMAQICGVINYLTNGLKMWKMTQRFGKWPKCLENGLDTWDTPLIFEKRLCYVGNGLEFDKRFKYVGNDVYIWEMAQVFEKRLNYVGNDLDLGEMAQICREMT